VRAVQSTKFFIFISFSFAFEQTSHHRKPIPTTQVASKQDVPEKLSVKTAIKAMTRSDVTVLVLDAFQGPTEQDFRLAERVQLSGRACVLCMNKWDLVPKEADTMAQYEKNLRGRLRNIDWANIVFTTATTGARVRTVLDAVKDAASEHRRRVTTATINQVQI
jgi:GTP-binding protein